MKIAFFLLLIFISYNSYSYQIDAYKCKVIGGKEVQSNGNLEATGYTNHYTNTEFVVDKETGKVIGKLINSNPQGKPQVLDYGSPQQAFKVLTVYRPIVSVDLLTINEFEESHDKTFLFQKGSTIFHGLCNPF